MQATTSVRQQAMSKSFSIWRLLACEIRCVDQAQKGRSRSLPRLLCRNAGEGKGLALSAEQAEASERCGKAG